jgi:hypothetical protein
MSPITEAGLRRQCAELSRDCRSRVLANDSANAYPVSQVWLDIAEVDTRVEPEDFRTNLFKASIVGQDNCSIKVMNRLPIGGVIPKSISAWRMLFEVANQAILASYIYRLLQISTPIGPDAWCPSN